MLAAVDEGLESFLRAVTPLSAVDIDLAFETPDDEWGAKLTRPTVSVHLWDIRRSSTRAVTGVETAMRNGVEVRRMALPRIDLRYFVSVWTTEHDDERALLGALTIALLSHSDVPAQYLPASISHLPSPQLSLARAGDTETFRLDGRMKLGLQLLLTAVVDTGAGTPLAKGVSDIGISLADRTTGAVSSPPRRIAGECQDPTAIGATIRSPLGVTVVNGSGRFLIAARAGDEIVLELQPPRSVVAPPVGGVVFASSDIGTARPTDAV